MEEDIWKYERTDIPLSMRAFAAGLFMKIAISDDGYGYRMHGGQGERGAFLKRIPIGEFEWALETKIQESKYPSSVCPAMAEFYEKFRETSTHFMFVESPGDGNTTVSPKVVEVQTCGKIFIVRRERQDVIEKNGWVDLKLTPREVAYCFVKKSKVIKNTTICTNAAEGKEVARILGLQQRPFEECF